MKLELIIQGFFMLGAVFIAGFHNWSPADINQGENIESEINMTESQDRLGKIDALKAYEARNKFRLSATYGTINQIEGINISNSLIKDLESNMSAEYSGIRIYYGDYEGSQIAIMYPLNSDGDEVRDLPSYSYAKLKDEVYITPCPPLCD